MLTSAYENNMQVLLVVLYGLALPHCRAKVYSLNTCLLTLKGQNSIFLTFENISF